MPWWTPNPAMTLIERVRLDTKANQLAGTLTLLERKRLELARALATRPNVLLLDEIAEGSSRRRLRR